MRCLVLGGAGFIGSHLVDLLVAGGHEVRILDVRHNQHWTPASQVDCRWADWSDETRLRSAVAGVDVVVHLIGTTYPGSSNLDMVHDVGTNVLGSLRVLRLCVEEKVGKIVFASSGGTVYGVSADSLVREQSPTQPISSYGVTKLMIEKYIQLFHHLHGLGFVILRPGNVYGERQEIDRPQGAVGVFMRRMLEGRPIEIWGDGRVVRDYLYVGDLARAYRLAVESPVSHGVFNVGSARGVSLSELLDELIAVTGLAPVVEYREARTFDVPANVLATGLIRSTLGWTPAVGMREGLERTWAWAREAATRAPGRERE